MKGNAYVLAMILPWVGLIIWVIWLYGIFHYRIHQDIKDCHDSEHFEVETNVMRRVEIIYSSRTYNYTDGSCLSIDQVQQVKENELKKAKEFIKKYKTIK